MHAYVRDRLPELTALCRRFHVKRLDLFGSGTGERFDPARSDLDFVVELFPDTEDRVDAYFGLKEEAEKLFGRDVDLVESGAIRNRYFREELNETKELVYAA
jgi:hypothetical protein